MKLSSKFLAVVSSILGVSVAGCGDDVPCMYGSPSASYEIKGLVTDTEGQPLEGIHVNLGSSWSEFIEVPYLDLDKIYTDNDGKFEVKLERSSILFDKKLYIRYRDENENYGEIQQQVNLKFSGKSDSWYIGTAFVDVSVKLPKLEK